jgi:hypothetical protein
MNCPHITKMVLIASLLVAGMARAQDVAAPADAAKMEKVTYLGVTAKAVDETLRAQLNLPDGVGLTVMTVDHKGPSAADIRQNDVLQKLDDQLLIDPHQLVTLIHLHHPGDAVTLTIIRKARPIQVTIKLGEKEKAVVPANDADHTNDLPDLKALPDATSPLFDTQLPLGPGGVAQVAMAFKDDVYSASVNTDKDGHQILTVKDTTGKIVAQGPIDTDEQWQQFPSDVRTHLEVMHRLIARQKK